MKRKKRSLMAGYSSPRCRSEMRRVVAMATTPRQKFPHRCSELSAQFYLVDDHILHRDVLMHPAVSGRDLLDLVDDILAFDDPTEHRVTIALRGRGRVVQEVVVLHVDEELRRCRMRIGCACHRDR